MTGSNPPFDADLESVLLDVAKQPRSKLFAISPRQLAGAFHDPEGIGLPPQANLSSAERHLVAAYRDEVAHLLLLLAKNVLWYEPDVLYPLSSILTADIEVRPAPDHELRSLAHRAAAFERGWRGDEAAGSWSKLLYRAITPSRQSMSATFLCIQAARLRETDAGRICMGIDLQRRRRFSTAVRLFHHVGRNSQSSLVRSIAWHDLGLAEIERGRSEVGLDALRKAALIEEPSLGSLIDWLSYAFQCGNDKEALEAARRLDDLPPRSLEAAEKLARQMAERKQLGKWHVTADAPHTVKRVHGLRSVSRRVAEIFGATDEWTMQSDVPPPFVRRRLASCPSG